MSLFEATFVSGRGAISSKELEAHSEEDATLMAKEIANRRKSLTLLTVTRIGPQPRPRPAAKRNKAITDYWLKYYTTPTSTLCELCANNGRIRVAPVSPAGIKIFTDTFCICPNGQVMRYNEARNEKFKKEWVAFRGPSD